MEKEIKKYLLSLSNTLNGQLRGSINSKARKMNFELIEITINKVFKTGYELGKSIKEQEKRLGKLKTDLGINLDDDERKSGV